MYWLFLFSYTLTFFVEPLDFINVLKKEMQIISVSNDKTKRSNTHCKVCKCSDETKSSLLHPIIHSPSICTSCPCWNLHIYHPLEYHLIPWENGIKILKNPAQALQDHVQQEDPEKDPVPDHMLGSLCRVPMPGHVPGPVCARPCARPSYKGS